MPISHEHKLILVHVPKNAGTSIQEAFGMDDMQGHHTAKQYVDQVPEIWESYTSLATVRNPYDRAVSAYEYAVKKKSYWHDANSPGNAIYGKHPDYDALKNKSFEYALRNIGSLQHHGWDRQVKYVCGDSGEVAVDEVVCVENLGEELEQFCDREDIEYPGLPFINESSSGAPWQSYYEDCDVCAEIVRERYAKDFDVFNYSHQL